MKKSLVIIAFFALTTATYAQIQKVSIGIMLPATATMGFPAQEKPFKTGFGVTPSFNVFMDRLHTHLMYDCSGNNAQALVGYVFADKYDVYLFGSKNLNSRGNYLGLGIEKAIVVNKNLAIVGYVETDLRIKSFTIGATLHPQLVLR
ncbi:MAG: hypothetical protein KBC12_00235 [Candidatus Pacebacteria bacterium]|nr:hypothetical protein [Candidatus Paceibacterota bacterium]MBP9851085.1 hypothetical protein [Candidatus Paceibacterota bacterium]